MSIEQSYRRITPAELAKLQSDSSWALSFLGLNLSDIDEMMSHQQDLQFSYRYLSIGKDWHAIHLLLTGEHELREHYQAQSPLQKVVMGGSATTYEATYGHVRSLNPDEVKEIAAALVLISEAELRERVDFQRFNELNIYPNPRPGGWNEGEMESVFLSYADLVDFFERAAEVGDAMLISSD